MYEIEALEYAKAKSLPDMEHGFTISTNYGLLVIDADAAPPIIKAVAKALDRKIAKVRKEAERG